jgi:hypothetical protein
VRVRSEEYTDFFFFNVLGLRLLSAASRALRVRSSSFSFFFLRLRNIWCFSSVVYSLPYRTEIITMRQSPPTVEPTMIAASSHP